MTTQGVVELTLVVQGLPWASAEDRDLVLAPLKSGSRKVCVGPWHPLDFQHFMRYLNEEQWDKQVGGATDAFGALQCLFMYLKDMGLDTPIEPTFAAMTAFRVLARGGTEAMNPGQYRQAYEYVKDVWKAVTKHLKAKSASVVFIKALPYDPQEFKREYPAVW